jgi:hypothetical protein
MIIDAITTGYLYILLLSCIFVRFLNIIPVINESRIIPDIFIILVGTKDVITE